MAGRTVVILPDNDAAGRGYAEAVTHHLAALVPPATVQVVDLPELSAGDDFVEYRAKCRAAGKNDLTIRAELEVLLKAAEPRKPAVRSMPSAFVPFPVHVLPDSIRCFVAKGAQAIGCDPSFVAMPLLVGLASAIGNTRRIELKRSWREPAIIWALIVGDSGTLKSPALELALRPLRKRQQQALRRYRESFNQYQSELADYERLLQEWRRSRSGEQPNKPIAPVADRCWCDDVTVEALGVMLSDQWRGLLLVRDELAGWVQGFDQYKGGKGGDAQKWLEMFGGRPMIIDRKGSDRPMISVDLAAVSITGGIQPDTLRRTLRSEHYENGLAARLIFAFPPRKPRRWTEADIDVADEARIEAVFERLFDLQPDTSLDGEPTPRILRLSPAGKEAWVRFFNQHAAEHEDLTGELSAAWSKLEGYAARLALVVHLIRWATGDHTLADADTVDETSVAAGVELSRWLGHEARRVYGILAESEDDRDHRRLLELIHRKGSELTPRELQQSSRRYATADAAEAALRELVKGGFGRWKDVDPTAKGGRPTRVFRLSEASTVYETPENSNENRGSVEVDSVGKPTNDAEPVGVGDGEEL